MRSAKFDQPTSRIDFCGSSSFPVEMEIRKLPIAEKTRNCLDLPYYIKFGLSTFLLYLFLKDTTLYVVISGGSKLNSWSHKTVALKM